MMKHLSFYPNIYREWITDHYFAYFCRENIGRIWNIGLDARQWTVYTELEFMGDMIVFYNPYFRMVRNGTTIWDRK